MKTTKLINGKSFDEIFEERGKKISINKAKKEMLYLFPDYGMGWSWLTVFVQFNNKMQHPASEVGTIHDLASDGDNFHIDSADPTRGFTKEQYPKVFEATPNQIALHDLYLRHEE